MVTFSGGKVLLVVSTVTTIGGVDHIDLGIGNNSVIGGYAGDFITIAGGNNLVFGDSATLQFQAGTGLLQTADSLAPADGGSDTITTGPGNDIIVGGIA